MSEGIPIEQLKNLATKSARVLAKVGINNRSDLEQLGSVNTFLKLEALEGFKPSLNFLYAMEAALDNTHWAKIDKQRKSKLLLLLDERRLHQKMFTKPDDQQIIQQTKNWINEFIITHNICPFAEQVVTNHSIDLDVINDLGYEDCLVQVIQKLIFLDENSNIETALMIFPEAVKDFDDYLEFLAIANQLIEDQGFDDDYQLASFHPDYCFEGEATDDPANFTNRAPWPMLHLIRQSSIDTGLKFHKHPEQIPEDNIKLTRELGFEFLSALRQRCMRIE